MADELLDLMDPTYEAIDKKREHIMEGEKKKRLREQCVEIYQIVLTPK